ncbi:MAG: hypothetical protein KDK39_14445 [Leptospiraceae bacterium]|nr:hypothetical protein [Leptospiraceae bacterium]
MSRQTASKYLSKLVEDGLLEKKQVANSHFFINTKLWDLIQNAFIAK